MSKISLEAAALCAAWSQSAMDGGVKIESLADKIDDTLRGNSLSEVAMAVSLVQAEMLKRLIKANPHLSVDDAIQAAATMTHQAYKLLTTPEKDKH